MAGQKQPLDLILYKNKQGSGKHLTKEEIKTRREQEVKANNDKVKPPNYLPKELRKEFNAISRELLDIGIITNLDVDSLAKLIINQKQWEDVTNAILQLDIVTQFGEYNELTKIQERLFKQVRAGATDLGLTISSRCKLVMPKKEEKEKKKTPQEQRFGDKL